VKSPSQEYEELWVFADDLIEMTGLQLAQELLGSIATESKIENA